jgi:hypothetical protein
MLEDGTSFFASKKLCFISYYRGKKIKMTRYASGIKWRDEVEDAL